MTFVSYAQNFEDVMLWRALKGVQAGFYIDVGAAHPDTDSVTRAFYDRGWSGINIEPVASSARWLRAARPRDVTLQVALGETCGRGELFLAEGTGLSTMEAGMVARLGESGFETEPTEVEVETLAAVCRRHAPADIHFLKIDVEGSERAVLAGADFAAFRPWVVLLEATAPMSQEQTHAEWEPILLASGYRFAWFDGLNRFYLAEERHAELSPHFTTPPNVFDDFLRAHDAEQARLLSQAETQAAERLDRLQETENRARAGDERSNAAHLRLAVQAAGAAQARADAAGARAEIEHLRNALAAAGARTREAEQAAQAAEQWLAAVRSSTSWRVTHPLRRAAALSGRLRGQQAPPPEPAPAAQPEPPAAAAAAGESPPPLRVVHQFHSGSATGDAITHAMLVTRALLRELGYESDIFVEHRDPALAGELRLLDELPAHSGYVLIVRHSMGYDAFPRIVALPAPKVLIYHNITPPEFLAHAPALQDYARLGREQLASMRPHIAAALADSEFNAIELRRLGFDPVQACPLLFDVEALRRQAGGPRPAGAPFTVLFVGRVIESKGQRKLIAAYARFNELYTARYDEPTRLVLVGRHDSAGSAYIESLNDLIRRERIDGQVQLTGGVSDDELHAWYAQADLYASVSQHEGFGVPLVEAMAHGVPVLAWAGGAVPYTLGPAGELLTDCAPSAVAGAMLKLAGRLHDKRCRAEILGRQAASLERFALGRQVPALALALARAGAAPPADPAARRALAAGLQVEVMGHVNGTYSLASANRDAALAIEAHRPGTVRLLPVEGAPTTDLSRVPLSCRAEIARLAGRPAPVTGPVVAISNHYPVWPPPDRRDLALASFFWEESAVPAETVAVLNAGFDGVLAPSAFVAKALVDSGVSRPVRVVGHAPDLDRFRRLREERRAREEGSPFTFLHVSSCFPRKGVDVLLAAFAAAFRAGDPVRLVIKGFPNPHNDVADQLAALQAADPGLPAIELIDRDLPEDALLDLYRAADAMVLPTRGEGFNLPAAEALAAGIPLIVTGFGGHMDFCRPGFADPSRVRLLDSRFVPSASHLASPRSVWAEPDAQDLADALREAVRDREAPQGAGPDFDRGAFVERLTDAAVDLLLAPPRPPLRLAWISSWDVRCGIAEYSRLLLAALPRSDAVVTILADERTAPSDNAHRAAQSARPAWRLCDPDSLPGLATAISVEDPHVVVIQHQPGLLGWAALAQLLADPTLRCRAVCVTLHNTLHLLDVPAPEREAAVAALGGAARVLVHTVADLNRMKGLGLVANVALLPHGAPAPRPGPAPRALTEADPALIGCYGFLLPGKGVPELIEAFSTLRRRWPAARLRLVNAEHHEAGSAAEIARCRGHAAELGVGAAVEFVTEFLDPERSLQLLAECDLVVLPYQASKEASSAALRTALAAGVPVATTPLALFDEASGAVVRFAGGSAAEIADGIDALLRDEALRAETARAGAAWLRERGWEGVAARMLGMLLGLAASPRQPPK